MAREKILREAGAALVATQDRDSVYAAALESALELTNPTPGVRVGLARGSGERMTVVASAGYRASEIEGHPLNVHALPEHLRARFLENQPVEVEQAEAADLREKLGLSSESRPFFLISMSIDEEVRGALGVTSDTPLAEETKEALVALSFQVALALESVALAEDRHWRQSEARFRALVQNSSDLIMVVSADDTISYVSPSVERIIGYPPQDLIGKNAFADFLHPDDFARVMASHEQVKQTQRAISPLEIRIRHRDGSWRYLEVIRNNLLDDPDVRGIVINSRDITERKLAEEKLRQSEVNLAQAQRIAHLGSWDFEHFELVNEGQLRADGEMRWSDEMYRIFGYEPQEFAPTFRALMEAIHPGDREYVSKIVLDAVSRRESSLVFEHRVLRPDGEVRFVQVRMEIVYAENGEMSRTLGTVLDITERKRADEELRRSERRLLNAQRIANVGDWSFDVVNNEAHWSDEMHRIFGLFPQRPILTYKKFLQLVHPDDRATVREMSREALRGEGRSSIDYRVVRPDGEVRYVHSQYEINQDASGRTTELIGTLQDVTELRRKEQELRRSEQRFRALVQNSLDVVTVVDTNATVLYYSPSFEVVMGYKPEEFVGKNALEVVPIHPEDLPYVRDIFGYLVENPGVNYSMEMRMRHADGSWRTVEATANNLLDDPSVGGIVTNYRDITERKAFERQLEHQAFHDDLTGLPNRALFMDRLEHALSRADKDEGSVAVLFMDLDNFKIINDSLGHQAGDELLVSVAGRLRGCLDSADTVARLSGDEFSILLEEIAEESDATRLADRIAARLQEPFEIRGQSAHLTVSTGIAFGAEDDSRPEELLRRADIAMYRAKRRGKAHYTLFDTGMDTEARDRLNLENDLRMAIENNELKVYYQPEVLLESGEICGFEALVRWEHPERGTIPPSTFIPVAEETGLIVPLGRQILSEACRQAREWQELNRNGTPVMVSVNLSAKQFQNPDLTQDVARILRETGLNERLLCLEVTETAAMEERRPAKTVLNALKSLGIKLAIDDFGTGYSSLSYLKDFPVDYLKIDRSIVTGLENDSPHWSIVLATITLAHALGPRVVAEGVETAEEFAKLRSLKCDLGQGHYFSEALPGHAATALLSPTLQIPYAKR